MTDTNTDQTTGTDTAVREYVRALLRSRLLDEEARQERIRDLEEAGHRIVDGGQTGRTDDGYATWEITDWRTGKLISSGTTDSESHGEAVRRIDPDDMWVHIDRVDTDLPEVKPVGVPASLADALQDWLGTTATSDEDVASVVGWGVEEVSRHRECS